MAGQEPCLSPIKCNCKKKTDKISDQEQSVTDGGGNNNLRDGGGNSGNSVKVGCKKSMDCFKKHSDGNFISNACGLANCLGICIPDGMCLRDKTDKCKGCPKYVWMGMQTAVYDAEKEKLRSRCISNKCSIPTRDSRLMFPGNHI